MVDAGDAWLYREAKDTKENVWPVQICLEATWFNGPWIGPVTLDVNIFVNSPYNFYWAFEVLKQPPFNAYNYLVYFVAASVAISCCPVTSARSLIYPPHPLTNRTLCCRTLDQWKSVLHDPCSYSLFPIGQRFWSVRLPMVAGVALLQYIVSLFPHSNGKRRNPSNFTWWNG